MKKKGGGKGKTKRTREAHDFHHRCVSVVGTLGRLREEGSDRRGLSGVCGGIWRNGCGGPGWRWVGDCVRIGRDRGGGRRGGTGKRQGGGQENGEHGERSRGLHSVLFCWRYFPENLVEMEESVGLLGSNQE